ARNSLRGCLAVSRPPTRQPSSMRQVALVSPSQPAKVLPSKSGVARAGGSSAAAGPSVTSAARPHVVPTNVTNGIAFMISLACHGTPGDGSAFTEERPTGPRLLLRRLSLHLDGAVAMVFP